MKEYINKLNIQPVIVYETFPNDKTSPNNPNTFFRPDPDGVGITYICAKFGVGIKYIYFTIRGFNRVDDPIHPNYPDKKDIEQFDVTLKTTGPYPLEGPKSESDLIWCIDSYKDYGSPHDFEFSRWSDIFDRDYPPKYIKIQKIRVVYKDNSEETIRNPQNMKNAFKQPCPKRPPLCYGDVSTMEEGEKAIASLRSYLDNPPYYK